MALAEIAPTAEEAGIEIPEEGFDDPRGLINALRQMALVDERNGTVKWATELIREAANMIEALALFDTSIVVTGDPVNGFVFHGPFMTEEAASELKDNIDTDNDDAVWTATLEAGYPQIEE